MSFRQNHKKTETLWRHEKRAALVAAGLPDCLVNSERRWNYLLEHGDDELESGWTTAWINEFQATTILKILEDHYDNRVGLDLFRTLRDRIEGEKTEKDPSNPTKDWHRPRMVQ